MKNIVRKLTCLIVPLLTIGCAQFLPNGNTSGEESSTNSSSSSGSRSSSRSSSSSSKSSSSSSAHTHEWSAGWTYDETNHWKTCSGCTQKNQNAAHTFGNWEDTSSSSLAGASEFKSAAAQIRACSVCGYYELKGDVLPKIYFTAPDISFASTATKSDLSRPEVEGTFTLNNCDSKYAKTEVSCTMKVRGNQTAGWAKKAFRIKFGSKINLLGLNKGNKFKKWILLADAKDTALIRTALGLKISRGVCKDDDQVWVSDYTPVSVYLNNKYWGYYYLAEQKEVYKDGGRVALAKPADGYTGTDIGYCFELDHYADSAGSRDEASEIAKGKDGDPTFRVKYSPRMEQGRPSGPLATGQVNTYTMLSDITDGPSDAEGEPTEHFQADYTNLNNGQLTNNSTKTSNSNQLSFIRDRMEALYQVLYYAAQGQAKEINDNNQVINSSKTIKQVMAQHFDLDAWVDGYIINAVSVPPDLGYSSFYMSYDNTPTGDKKLRYDVPWDFDSNFGNRNNFYVNAEGDTYVENTYNTWLYLLSKLNFFIDMVKVKWNKIREDKLFEDMFGMMRKYFAIYDAEIKKNHQKWPQNDAAHQPPNNFDEIREPYKDPAKYKQAEAETISWCAKRVNFLEKKWGNNRADVDTYAHS